MTVTEEQAQQAQGIILDCLKQHHPHGVSFQKAWAKGTHDLDDMPFLDVWVIFEGEATNLDIALLNSFDTYLMGELREIGIQAFTSISYVPLSEVDQLEAPWTR